MKKNISTTSAVLGFLIIVLSIEFLYFSYNAVMALWSYSWPMTRGRIISNSSVNKRVVDIIDTRGGEPRQETYNVEVADFRYAYSVNDETFDSSRVSYFDSSYGVNIYSAIDVYYNNLFPSISVIYTGFHYRSGEFVVASLSFLATLSLILYIKNKYRL